MAGKDETRKIEIIMNGQKANASIKEMKASASLLWNQMAKLPQKSKEFIAKSKEFQQVSSRLKGVTAEARGVSNGMSLLTGTVGKLFGAFGAYTILNKIGQAYDYVTGKTKAFEKSLSTLKSITGASADDMLFYEKEAKKMGDTTTLSASQVADAYTLIGSKKPELLKNKEALAEVTNEAIVLAEAAKTDLVPAADALTAIMNQWGLSASEASRTINVLAAGSKYGAGDIQYLNDSMTRFGPTASAMNIKLEESAAVMEVFAEKGVISQKAGTQFRNILVELAKGADETNPEIVGLDKAIENLGKQNLSTADLANKFGKENLVGAQILVNSSERVREFTKALTGTNVAYEQQAINIDNWEGDLKSLDSVQETLALNIGDRMLPALRASTQAWRDALRVVSGWFEVPVSEKLEEEKSKLNNLVRAIGNTNEGTEVNKRLREELLAKYPEFMSALDMETATNEDLRDRLKEVNAQYEQKILNQLKEEEVTELLKEQIELREDERDMLLEIARLEAADKVDFRGMKIGAIEQRLKANRAEMAEIDGAISALDEKYKFLGLTMEENGEVIDKVTEKKVIAAKVDEKLTETNIKAQRTFQDLRISIIEDGHERERQKTIVKYNRDIEDLDKQSADYLERVVMLEQLKQQELDELQEKYDLKQAEEADARNLQRIEDMDAEKEMRLLEVENAFMNAVNAERAREDALYEVQREYAQKKLDLLIAVHGEESVEVKRARNELLQIEKDRDTARIEHEAAFQQAKRDLMYEGLDASISILESGLDLLKKESDARKMAAKALKAFTIGKILIDLQHEIQAIWKNANASPLNILVPGSGALLAAGKTAAAVGRSAVAVKKVRAQKFASGGGTLPMVEVDGVWKMAKQIGSYAKGGMYAGNNLGVIGEKGAEWVAPNWMLRNPATANVIGMLEAKRQQVNAYADGGGTVSQSDRGMGMFGNGMDLSALEILLRDNNQLLLQMVELVGAWPAQLKVIQSLVDVDDGLKLLQKLRSDSSIVS